MNLTLFLDYYLTIPHNDFSHLLSFTTKEIKDIIYVDKGDLVPDKVYDK